MLYFRKLTTAHHEAIELAAMENPKMKEFAKMLAEPGNNPQNEPIPIQKLLRASQLMGELYHDLPPEIIEEFKALYCGESEPIAVA